MWTLTRWSRRQDEGDMSVNLRLQYLAGGGLVVYALTATFASVDWIMSINPHWYSTLFGFIRSEEQTSELQSLMRTSYAVFCLKKKNQCSDSTLQHMVCESE